MKPESALELRLEGIKRLGNLQLKLLECVYGRRPIAERYANGDATLHIHGSAGHYLFCAEWRRRDVELTSDRYEVPVFVGIGQGLEHTRPVTSVERLQSLDRCNMLITDTFEKGIAPSPETIFSILNRKLRSVYDIADVQLSQVIDEVIQGGPQVIGDLANEYADDRWDLRCEWHGHRPDDTNHLTSLYDQGLCCVLTDDTITVFLTEDISSTIQIRQVYACPSHPLISAIERLHMLWSTRSNKSSTDYSMRVHPNAAEPGSVCN